ncbi:MAG TPA: Clp protease N-terminal domain-containing protein [Gaiellaceae bacterium]|jgi:ATP-dependent Clp protease ATP-binding subunit ClpA|nr:Clp protease N-terminal domain-containing protein [Gaiellaceae bacterium]
MTLDENVLAEARELRARLLDLQRDAERTQVDYHHAIRRLQAQGGSLREIAVELGLSHQRVHQIVGADVADDRPGRGHRRGSLARFTRAARAVVAAAEEEARALGHSRVGTEHLLLGAALVKAGGAAAALQAAGVDAERMREALVAAQPAGPEPRRRHLPFTRAAKRSLENALAEAVHLRTRWIGSEHVLLGVLATERGGAVELLGAIGVDPGAVRGATLDRLAAG